MARMSTTNGQDNVIALLSRPESFGAEAVEVVETHGSLVFLAGERAYKLKRAVRYSYLDYSTPERRREACEAELAVNRRFAPSLYLGVAPVVRGADGRLRLGGEGVPVDWLVVMRRFDQAAQFDRMAERGALTPELMRALADRLAELHAAAGPRPGHGGVGGLGRAVAITVENLRPEAGAAFAADAVEDWTARAQTALRAQSRLLEHRRLAGKVRACHGDLHLRNICLIDGRPTPFDAIEFDPDISSTDVLYDLAFLLMDLHGRGLDRLGNVVFNRYLDRVDEADGSAALPLFLSVRAAVRAQVSAAAARRTHDPARARASLAEAARYLALARELLDPPKPRLVAIGGLSGTGKSTLAYGLAPDLGRPPGARVLRSDVLRKRAAGVALETPLPEQAYTAQAHADTYRELVDEARACLGAGQAAVADAVFADPAEQGAIEAAARAEGVPFHGLWLTAPIDVLVRRVSGRAGDASDATAEVVRAQAARGDPPPAGWTSLDASGGPEDVRRVAADALAGAAPGGAPRRQEVARASRSAELPAVGVEIAASSPDPSPA